MLLGPACSKYYGCDEELDCREDEPSEGMLILKLSSPKEGDSVQVEVRQGNWKKGKVIHNQAHTRERIAISSPLQHRYTAEATYAAKQDSLRAYNSGRLDLDDFKNCGEVCYKADTLILELERADR